MKPQVIPVNSALREFLGDHRILPKGSTMAKVKAVRLHSNLRVSPWTQHVLRPNGTMILNSMGYLSYSYADMPLLQSGAYCSIASGAQIMGQTHPLERVSTHPLSYGANYVAMAEDLGIKEYRLNTPFNPPNRPVEAGSDVWIGGGAVISRGVKIGTGAVIAAHSIVTKDVPPYAIVAGVPAKVVRYRFSEAIIAKLLASRWWEYDLVALGRFSFEDPEAFCKAFENAKVTMKPRTDKAVTAADLRKLADQTPKPQKSK